MNEAHKTIIERMKESLETICKCDIYIDKEELNFGEVGKKDLTKAILEYDSLARIHRNSPKVKKLQEEYRNIRETYGLK